MSKRKYDPRACVVFRRTRDEFGALSNMAAGFPLIVNAVRVRSSEALYQSFRFPHLPELQREILDQRSPMSAKMKSRRYRDQTRSDWTEVRVNAMRWCLRLKFGQHRDTFGALLLSTADRPIVEYSRRDAFWGAKPTAEGLLAGTNALGRLLAELRSEVRDHPECTYGRIGSPAVPNALFLAEPLTGVSYERARKEAAAQMRLPLTETH
ncbi:MAG: NADAR family protein [Chloroflexi bacterium]|nr:NADAR family protein [Chloroflexota bacterium]